MNEPPEPESVTVGAPMATATFKISDANQNVSFNLHLARQLRGWSQEEAAAKLEPYLGTRWSKASYSAAERFGGDRIKKWDAAELEALSRAFDLPVSYWFLPPPVLEDWGLLDLAKARLDVAIGVNVELEERLRDLFRKAPQLAQWWQQTRETRERADQEAQAAARAFHAIAITDTGLTQSDSIEVQKHEKEKERQ